MPRTIDIQIMQGNGDEWIADVQTGEGYDFVTDMIGEERVTDAEAVILTREEALAIRSQSPTRGIVCVCDARLMYG